MKQQKRLTTWGKTHKPEAYQGNQLTAGENVPNSQCVRPKSQWDSQKREWKMHQQLQKREEDNPGPGITKTTSNPWEKWIQPPKREWNHTGKTPAAPKTWGNWKTWMPSQNGIRFWVFFLPRKSEHDFQKWVSAQFEFWLPILFPFHAITNSTTFWQN